MNLKNKLRNSLLRKIERLSPDKLTEVNELLSKIENQLKSKEKTLALAGSWKEMGDELFADLTEKLHNNRTNDKRIF